MSRYLEDWEREEFRETKSGFRCSDRMCGADDCGNCRPSVRVSTRLHILPDDDDIQESLDMLDRAADEFLEGK